MNKREKREMKIILEQMTKAAEKSKKIQCFIVNHVKGANGKFSRYTDILTAHMAEDLEILSEHILREIDSIEELMSGEVKEWIF